MSIRGRMNHWEITTQVNYWFISFWKNNRSLKTDLMMYTANALIQVFRLFIYKKVRKILVLQAIKNTQCKNVKIRIRNKTSKNNKTIMWKILFPSFNIIVKCVSLYNKCIWQILLSIIGVDRLFNVCTFI